jgi:hypothetical protein
MLSLIQCDVLLHLLALPQELPSDRAATAALLPASGDALVSFVSKYFLAPTPIWPY